MNREDNGYQTHIFFLWIPSSKLALERIKDRVAKGGHNIPTEDVIRRFSRSVNNLFNLYMPLVDTWHLFDNSSQTPNLIAKNVGKSVTILDADVFKKIKGDGCET